jgi:hypothetical protein
MEGGICSLCCRADFLAAERVHIGPSRGTPTCRSALSRTEPSIPSICRKSDSFSSKGTVASRLRPNERRVRPKRSELTLRRTTDQRPVASIAHAAMYRETRIFARRHPLHKQRSTQRLREPRAQRAPAENRRSQLPVKQVGLPSTLPQLRGAVRCCRGCVAVPNSESHLIGRPLLQFPSRLSTSKFIPRPQVPLGRCD